MPAPSCGKGDTEVGCADDSRAPKNKRAYNAPRD